MALDVAQFKVLAEVYGQERIKKLVDEMNHLETATTKARKEQDVIEKTSKRASIGFDSLGKVVAKVGAIFTALTTGAFAIFLAKSAEAASRATEVQNLFDVSFGNIAAAAEDWAQRTQAAVGVNDTTLKQFSGTLFNMVTSMGVARDEAFQLATGFTELALDTSSFFNISFEEAFDKIRAGLSGESEPLKQLGVLVTENTIKQTAFAQSILATGRQLTETEKVQARAIVIQEGLANAAGDLIRTQDSWANQTRLVGEAFVNLQETVGQFITNSELLGGILRQITELMNDMSTSLNDNSSAWEQLVSKGLLFFLQVVRQTISVAGFLIKVLGYLTSALYTIGQGATFGALGMTEFGKSMQGAGVELRAIGEDVGAASDKMGAAIDELVNASGRQNDAFHQTDLIIANFEARAGDLAKTLRSDLKRAIEEGGTIPMETWNKVVEAFGGQTDLAQEVIGRLTAEIASHRTVVAGTTTDYKELLKAQKEAAKAAEELAKSSREIVIADIHYRDTQGGLAKALQDTKGAQDQVNDSLYAGGEIVQTINQRTAALAAGYKQAAPSIVPLTLNTIDWGEAMDRVNDFLSETRGLMTLLGVDADSTFGKIIAGISKAFDAFNSLLGIVSKVLGLFGSGGLGGIGSIFGGLGSLFGGGPSGSNLFGAAAGVGGLGGGGGAGGLLSGLAGFFTNPLTAIIGGGVLGGIGLAKLFGRKGSAETTAKATGFDFDALSKGLQKTLQDMGKQVGDFATAIQLNLGQVIGEGGLGRDFDLMAEKAADTFSFLDRGQINATQAQQILNDTVGQLIPTVDEMGAEGVYQLERLLAAAARTGVSFDGMSELAAAYVERANELGIAVNDVALAALGLSDVLSGVGAAAADNFGQATAAANKYADAANKAAAATAGSGYNPDYGPGNAPKYQHGGFVPETPPFGRIVRVGEPGTGGEDIIPRRGGRSAPAAAGVTVGNVNISVSGAGDPERVARAVQIAFRDNLRNIRDVQGRYPSE